ncbi:MAG: response regulator transcription factor [Clostridia bacterium]|nr:response regulator transcription factor [Clostridia bacterium]
MFNIMVVEDDTALNRLFCKVLEKNGYNPLPAYDGIEALEVLDTQYVDLIICDIMMPRMDGFQLTREIRAAQMTLPILMITAKGDIMDKQQGFDAGTDDYMVKPVDVNEMVMRVGALLRRAKIASDRSIEVGGTKLNYDSLEVSVKGQISVIPQKEFYLLFKLLSNAGRIFTRNQLMDEIWGMDSETEPRTVDVHINRLRDRFKENDDFEIVTVRGLGYKAVKK